MNSSLLTIGLDPPLVAKLRTRLDRPVRACPVPPAIAVRGGQTFAESARVSGRFDLVAGVVWHGYFDDVGDTRRALAISTTPSFPDLRATLPLDERLVALAMATRVDGATVPRGVLRASETYVAATPSVAKWGDRHCGEGKARFEGPYQAEALTLVEPFFEGSSERVLLVGEAVWQLRYDSEDWRKNVRARVTPVEPDPDLVARARKLATALALPLVGVDFLRHAEGATLLEVNAYPALEDAPGAEEAFVDEVARWAATALA